MTSLRLLHGTLFALLAYNAAFFYLHLTERARLWKNALDDVQSVLNIMELIAVAALFVDLVIRFDHIPKPRQTLWVMGVGLCVAGMLFKWFVLYLRLSYLVD